MRRFVNCRFQADRVDSWREHWPAACPHCQHNLTEVRAERLPALRQQVWEIPAVRAEVTEHRYHAVICPDLLQPALRRII